VLPPRSAPLQGLLWSQAIVGRVPLALSFMRAEDACACDVLDGEHCRRAFFVPGISLCRGGVTKRVTSAGMRTVKAPAGNG